MMDEVMAGTQSVDDDGDDFGKCQRHDVKLNFSQILIGISNRAVAETRENR